jgi:hypothetical protein
VSESRTAVAFAVDVEPDDPDFAPNSYAPWTGFEAAIDLFAAIRDKLGHATGCDVRLTWFVRMDPQIVQGYGSATWFAERYASEIGGLRAAGDEVGLHTHAWRRSSDGTSWIADVGNEAWLDECVSISFDAYESAFGAHCRAHRSGDRFMSNALLASLRRAGVRVDLTPEPGMRGVATGPSRSHTAAIPAMDAVPRAPYVPSADDWRQRTKPGTEDGFMFVPLTAVDPGPSLARWRAATRLLTNIGRPLYRPLLPWAPGIGQRIWDLVEPDVRSGRLPVLAFAMRSHGAADAVSREALLASVDALERHELVSSLRFVSASEAAGSGAALAPAGHGETM